MKSLLESYIDMRKPMNEDHPDGFDPVLVDKLDPKHICKTPNTIYHTEVHGNTISVSMDLPDYIEIPSDDKFNMKLEANLHYALEGILTQLFKFRKIEKTK